MSAKEDVIVYAGAAAIIGIGAYLVIRNFGTVASAASGAVGSGVQSLGTVVGVERTNEALCETALATENLFDASKYCPAATFIRASANRMRGLTLQGAQKADSVIDQSEAETARLGRSGASYVYPDQTDAETARLLRSGQAHFFDPDALAERKRAAFSAIDSDTSIVYDSDVSEFDNSPFRVGA